MTPNQCPKCSENITPGQALCPKCGWQFTVSPPAGSVLAPGHIPTVARAATRPNWICANACQLAVLVRDRSGSMAGEKARDASNASRDLLRVLADDANRGGFYAAVIDFGTTASVIHPANKASDLINVLADIKSGWLSGGSTNITDGLRHADRIISAFAPADGRHQLRPVVVLFSDGGHNEGPAPDAIAASLKGKADLLCIAFGQNADEADLRKWASPQLFTRCTTGSDLRKFFAAVGRTMQATRARGTNATQALASIQVP